jgi:hypothetical protein
MLSQLKFKMKQQLLLLALLIVGFNCITFSAEHDGALSSKFTLTVEYAANAGQPFKASNFVVLWNNVEFPEIFPKDYARHTLTYQVEGIVGENILNVDGTGNHAEFGVGIGSISLVREGGEDVVVNGHFNQGVRAGASNIYNNGELAGWIENHGTGKIEIGLGSTYNLVWGANDNINQLNAEQTSDIYQSICLNVDYTVYPCDQDAPAVGVK